MKDRLYNITTNHKSQKGNCIMNKINTNLDKNPLYTL